MNDNERLNNLMAEGHPAKSSEVTGNYSFGVGDAPVPPMHNRQDLDLCQWQVGPNGMFRPAAKTVPVLPPGAYAVSQDENGAYLSTQQLLSDDIVRLPESANITVLDAIRKFWASRQRYTSHGLLFKRGVLLWGPPGCHAAGTEVIMHDGSSRRVEDVVVGDLLLGPDGEARSVLALCRGCDDMYRVTPVKGEPFDVNGHHVLSLVRSRYRDQRYPTRLNTTVNEYLGLSECSQRSFKLLHAGPMDFATDSPVLPMDPYFLGAWLGDGHERITAITTADEEIREYCYAMAAANSLQVREERTTDSICRTLHLTSGVGGGVGGNPLRTQLQELNLIENKHIPEQYLTASIPVRLQLLAGLIDTDGGNEGAWRNSARYEHTGTGKGFFSITQKRELLSFQIVRLARSLGFGTTIRPVTKTLKSRNFSGKYWRVSIYGDIHRVPVRVPRKQSVKGTPNKNHLHTGIRRIDPLGIGAYYGFTLSGDHLYITGDYVVHHNSGKTISCHLLTQDLIAKGGIVVFCGHPDLTSFMVSAIRRIEKERPLILVYEDIDEIISKYGEHTILALLDGEQQTDNVVSVATTNYPERLGARIVNRPSRFDDRIFVGMPSEAARLAYLTKAVGQETGNVAQWAKDTKGLSIAHLRELVAAVMCLDQEYGDVLDRLQSMNERPKDVDGYARRAAGFGLDAI